MLFFFFFLQNLSETVTFMVRDLFEILMNAKAFPPANACTLFRTTFMLGFLSGSQTFLRPILCIPGTRVK